VNELTSQWMYKRFQTRKEIDAATHSVLSFCTSTRTPPSLEGPGSRWRAQRGRRRRPLHRGRWCRWTAGRMGPLRRRALHGKARQCASPTLGTARSGALGPGWGRRERDAGQTCRVGRGAITTLPGPRPTLRASEGTTVHLQCDRDGRGVRGHRGRTTK